MDKILIPIDSVEQEHSLRAVENAVETAKDFKAESRPELIFIHFGASVADNVPESEKERLQKLAREKMEKEFETVAKTCEKEGIGRFKTLVKRAEQDIDKEIVVYAQEENVDLIVMGSGKIENRSISNKIDKFLFGSTAEEVLRKAPCPVQVALPKEEP